jgi:hypothetical protein
MATPTKTLRTLLASVSLAVSSSQPASLGTGSVDLRTTLGMLVTTKITNSSSAPTVGAVINVYTSGDGTNWKLYQTAQGGTASSGIYEFPFIIPDKAMYVAIQFTLGIATNGVTVEAFGQEFTSFL